MGANIGTLDRVLRAVLGLAALWAVFMGPLASEAWPALRIVALVVGIVLIGTAAIKFCPAYRLIGVKTCKT